MARLQRAVRSTAVWYSFDSITVTHPNSLAITAGTQQWQFRLGNCNCLIRNRIDYFLMSLHMRGEVWQLQFDWRFTLMLIKWKMKTSLLVCLLRSPQWWQKGGDIFLTAEEDGWRCDRQQCANHLPCPVSQGCVQVWITSYFSGIPLNSRKWLKGTSYA